MDSTAAVTFVLSLILLVMLTGFIVWHTMQSHVHCVAEINNAWAAAARARDDAWARTIQERKVHAKEREYLYQQSAVLAGHLAKVSEHDIKLTQAVVTLWEKGKIESIT